MTDRPTEPLGGDPWWTAGDPWGAPPTAPTATATAPSRPTTWAGGWGEPPPPAEAERRGRRDRRYGLGAVAGVALVASLLGGAVGGGLVEQSGETSTTSPSTSLGTAGGPAVDRPPGSIAAIAQRVLPSVLSVKVQTSSGKGTGSAWVVDGKGYLITNNHVVAGAADGRGSISVVFQDGTSEAAQVVGRAPTLDIAVLKVADLHGARALPLGDSDKIAVGDPVIAFGSPLGLAGTVTSGIVSAKHRAVDTGDGSGDPGAALDAVQTDAAINPGNSGGPLVDGAGRVIGVNSAIASLGSGLGGGQSGSIGVGFAIPISTVRGAGEEIIRTGHASRPILGVTLVRASDAAGAAIGCDTSSSCQGVAAGGPADRAGIRSGDVVVKLGSDRVTSATDLILALRRHRVGETVEVVVRRGGATQTKQVTLGSGTA